MQKLSVNLLEPGMVTHTRVHSADGNILLGSQLALTNNYIKSLSKLGVTSIYIKNPLLEKLGVEYDETLSEETKLQAVKTLKACFLEAKSGCSLDVSKLSRLAATIVDSVKRNQLIRLDNSFLPEDYLYIHCVNVAALSTVLAYDLGYPTARLHDLIMGALLHDIGIALLNKEHDFAFMEDDTEHPTIGFEYVRKLRNYSTLSSHVVFGHHEWYDGNGYPRGIEGEGISEYARIVALADTYDLLISEWSGAQPLLPHEAYEALMSMSTSAFDKQLADLFLAKLPLYPVGCFVKLDTGHVGIVSQALPKLQSRPEIMVIQDPAGTFFDQPQTVDLTKHLTTFIHQVLSEKETVALSKQYSERGS